MTITELRNYTGMERREFANFYHIPYSTLQCWEKRDEDPKNINGRSCPPYVLYLLELIIVHDNDRKKRINQCEGDIQPEVK